MMIMRLLAAAAAALAFTVAPAAAASLDKISHILIIYLENRSFDNLFGEFPGANGLASPGAKIIQRMRDKDETAYPTLPAPVDPLPFDLPDNLPEVRSLTLEGLDNAPFAIDGVRKGVTIATYTRDLDHQFYTHRAQIHGGANDWYVAFSDARALTMGHYSAASMKNTNIWQLAKDNVLLDNFFQGAFGGSFLNHIWFICGCAPVWLNPPAHERSELDDHGYPLSERQDARVTAAKDGDYAVNTTQSIFLNDGRSSTVLLPRQTMPTIGDRLTAKGIDWAWYSGGWNLAITPARTPEEQSKLDKEVRFQWHHQPFAYFDRFDPSTPEGRAQRRLHLKDATDLATDIKTGQLPPVAFYKPAGFENQHSRYSNIVVADREVQRVVDLMNVSPMKASYAIIITHDEFGGFFDHAKPPAGPEAGARADFFGPGARVPAIVVSPFVKHGMIDSRPYQASSILKMIEERFDLQPLPSPRIRAVESLARVFDGAP
jgi:acid phosphatase